MVYALFLKMIIKMSLHEMSDYLDNLEKSDNLVTIEEFEKIKEISNHPVLSIRVKCWKILEKSIENSKSIRTYEKDRLYRVKYYTKTSLIILCAISKHENIQISTEFVEKLSKSDISAVFQSIKKLTKLNSLEGQELITGSIHF